MSDGDTRKCWLPDRTETISSMPCTSRPQDKYCHKSDWSTMLSEKDCGGGGCVAWQEEGASTSFEDGGPTSLSLLSVEIRL